MQHPRSPGIAQRSGLHSGHGCEVRQGGLVRVFQRLDDGRNRLVDLTKDGKQIRGEIEGICASAA